ncbi:MAG: NSS family neurotransmitter:Na+ symporter [Halieaceae bacterium]|jgi:NSS family neurotransmitter:Na+ symporter
MLENESPMQSSAQTPTFSSFLTTVLTLLGVAVGLGNVWRFPYMMGIYGGSAFLLLFVVLMCLVGIPALMCELALARAHRGATITVLSKSFGPFGRILGYIMVLGILCSGSYYTLVVGNVFYSAWYSMVHGFTSQTLGDFSTDLSNSGLQYTISLVVLWAGLYVIGRGLKRGIERVSEICVPFFFVVAIYLVYVATNLPGATAAVTEFFKPDFSQIGITELFAALGQVFFSVGLGATFVLVYGKYISDETKLGRVAILSASGDTLASILATLFIVPTVIVFGMELNGGPTLLFETVPALLSEMPTGRVVGSFMLGALSLVSFLSAVAVFQVVFVSLSEEPVGQWLGKKYLLLSIGLVESLAMIYPGWHPEIIGILDLIIGSGFMVTGGLLAVLAMTWCYGRAGAMQQIFTAENPGPVYGLVFIWMRYVIPVALFGILMATIVGTIVGE